MTKKGFVKFVGTLLFSWMMIPTQARVVKVDIGINGLTCSQCTRSVEEQLRKLRFVSDVHMNLEHTKGYINIKENARVDFDAIAQSVINAGFSLRFLKAEFKPEDVLMDPGELCFKMEGNAYVLLSPLIDDRPTNIFQLIGKKYLPRNEIKNYPLPLKNHCTGNKIFYVKPL